MVGNAIVIIENTNVMVNNAIVTREKGNVTLIYTGGACRNV
ncbi:hypothetical protein Cycma_2131 [Cyclobacterium marinum DSM 745]|uniref:Uncharacterized protein n=1 Tax=Cyclobacterium marinum (strain ATCC 25205 / DSM 745 / LMG 13164 / NCIMB 1802) TaxID=880070 RepID=G0J2I5_CYCMS|nr:hypothetical protein Cycma_2131 [Cyclobacterium marinum DSM 745]